MNLAKFTALDPLRPRLSKRELDDLLGRMDGVINWTIDHGREVTVAYDTDFISDQMIEGALKGVGFRLHHMYEETDASAEEIRRALGEPRV